MNSSYWQKTMDYYKARGAETIYPEAKALYGRAEMMARAEFEMSEAEEAVERKNNHV